MVTNLSAGPRPVVGHRCLFLTSCANVATQKGAKNKSKRSLMDSFIAPIGPNLPKYDYLPVKGIQPM